MHLLKIIFFFFYSQLSLISFSKLIHLFQNYLPLRSQSQSVKVPGGLQTTYYFCPVKIHHHHLSTSYPTRLPQSRKPQLGTKHLLSNPSEHGVLYLARHISIASQRSRRGSPSVATQSMPQIPQEPALERL